MSDAAEKLSALSVPELLEELKALDSTTLEFVQKLAKRNLYFVSKGILRHKDVNKLTHGAFCRFIERDEHDTRLGLMPRFHLKSSIAVEADCTRLLLSDPENMTILIVNEIEDNSVAFAEVVKNQFTGNEIIHTLFPELKVTRTSGPDVKWSKTEASLPQKNKSVKEPSLMAVGINTAVTSKHFRRIKCDDLIGLEARRSPAKMKEAVGWVNNVEPLRISGSGESIIDFIGTRWTENDVYQHIIEVYGAALGFFSRPVSEDGELIFPSKINWEFLERIRRADPEVFHAQMMNDPVSSIARDFVPEGIRSFKFTNSGECIAGREREIRWPYENLDRVITVDPNSGSKTAPDEAAVICAGMSPAGELFVLDEYGGRPSPSELVTIVWKMARRWRPRVIGFEQAGQQTTLHYFKKRMRKRGLFFNVTPLKHNNRSKEERIRTSLQPIVASRDLFLLPSQTTLRMQLTKFPNIKNDDRVDALAYVTEIARPPMATEQQAKNEDIVKKILQARNSRTGY